MSETTEIERVELHRLRTGIESKRDSLRSHNGDLLRNRSVADKFSLDAVSRERYEQRECFAEWLDALLNAKGNDRAGKRARQSRSLRIRQAEETTMSGEAENTVRYREDERGEKLAQAVRGLQDFWRSGERDHHMYSPFTRQAAICADQLDAALRDYDSAAPQPASTWVEPYPDTHLVPETSSSVAPGPRSIGFEHDDEDAALKTHDTLVSEMKRLGMNDCYVVTEFLGETERRTKIEVN